MSGPSRNERAFLLFDELIELDVTERSARLVALAVEQPELAGEVAALVAAHVAAGDFLERPAVEDEATLGEALLAGDHGGRELESGALVGAWRLVHPLGAGGMGEVWEVERADGQFEQRAALKLLKRGVDTDEVVRRFRVERQILARLRHPGIAHLYDGGVAPDGRPFYVMELVDGEPITTACARRRLAVEERLRLVLAVCDAVEAAHRSLVVHRDLKPSNVLVTAGGEVKLLDFGIAKLLSDADGDGTATRAWERLMTPAYAAPEQILGEPITTATDVYALGVMLYRLLTGRLPHRRPLGAAARLVEEVTRETVERPSTAVRRVAAGESEEPIADGERERRSRRLSGDLDSIVLRALAREPERRYPSAAALAADLRRHLGGQPVEARPDSLRYRAGKLVRRHRLAFAAAALVLLSLLGGLAASLWQAREARAQAARAARVKELLVGVFLGADPEEAEGASLTARELLAAGTRRVEKDLHEEPGVQAELLTTIARIEEGLGLLEPALLRARRALAVAERAYGRDDPRLMEPLAILGGILSNLERDDESLVVRERALEIARDRFAPDSLEVAAGESEVINAYFGLDRFAEALPMAEHALRVRRARLGEDHLDTIRSKLHLAWVLEFVDRNAEALDVGRDVLASYERALGPDDPRTLEAGHNLAVSLAWQGHNREAVALFARVVDGRRRVLGAKDFRLAFSLQQSTLPLRDLERFAEADRAGREALEIFRAHDPAYPEIANVIHGLGSSRFACGDFAEAEASYRQAVALWTAGRGPEHRSTLQGRAVLANALAELGRVEEAEAMARAALAARERIFGAESAFVAHSRYVLGEVLRLAGRADEAAAEHARSRALAAKVFPDPHKTIVRADLGLAFALLDGGAERRAEAETVLARAAAAQRTLDAGHTRLAEVDLARARLALAAGRRAEAARLAAAAREQLAGRLGGDCPRVAEAERLAAEAER